MTKSGHLCFWVLLVSPVLNAQQLLVFPAVTAEQPGMNGSLWVTTALVIKEDPGDEVTIRRRWVCLRGGGFADDPATAPTWSLADSDPRDRMLYASGAELLTGTDATVGAVALEVDGGGVIANSNIMDVQWGEYSREDKLAFGQGQHIAGMLEPLDGPSHIPWLGGCTGTSCETPSSTQQYVRNNIGIINPNPVSITIEGKVLPFGLQYDSWDQTRWSEWAGGQAERFHRTIPAYGWIQFHWQSLRNYASHWGDFFPRAGFLISLTADQPLPYYAYASVVFSPGPDSGIQAFNDPMFIPAEPGYVAPIAEVVEPQ